MTTTAAVVGKKELVVLPSDCDDDDDDDEGNVVQTEGAEKATTEEATKEKEEGGGCVWYFAIGSMCNPISIANRDITVLASYPAQVLNYALKFFGMSGMAGAVYETGSSFHGVLHNMSSDDKLKLDQIEMGYDAVSCTVQLYDGTMNDTALIYVMNAEKLKESYGEKQQEHNRPPTERYITIITEGCAHYGVDEEYIHYLKSLEYQPRKDPSHFETLPHDAENLPTMTMADVEAADGKEGNPLYTTCNGKVLHHVGLPPMFVEKLQQYKIHKQIHSYEVWLHTFLYDPLYGVLKSQDDLTKLCAAATEDQIVVWSKYRRPNTSNDGKEGPKTVVVGFIDLPYKDD